MSRRRTIHLFTALAGLLIATEARADLAPMPGEERSPRTRPQPEPRPVVDDSPIPVVEEPAEVVEKPAEVAPEPAKPEVAERPPEEPVVAEKPPEPPAEAKGGCSIGDGPGGAPLGLALGLVIVTAGRRRR